MSLPFLRQTLQGTEISIYVQPRASRNQLVGIIGSELKLRLAAPPVDGAANQECRSFLAKFCRLPKNRVILLAGETSRHKRLLLESADLVEISPLFSDLAGVDNH